MVESDIRLSVIIPGYNTPEAWWKRCVDSVLKAIGPADEIILVDDGSVESLKLRIKNLELADGRVKVLYKTNGGLSSARNAALDVARGRFVTFVDSDDEVSPDVYERCLRKLEQTGCDVCLFGLKTIWTDEGLAKIDLPNDRVYRELSPGDIKDLTHRCLFNYACNKVYRRKNIEEDGQPLRFNHDGMPCEDTIFNLACVLRGTKWCSVDVLGYYYYRTNGSLLAKYKPSNLKGEVAGSNAWMEYKRLTPGAREILGGYGETSQTALDALEWRNIWKPGSPYSLLGRWEWLRQHPQMGGVGCFLRMLVFSFIRWHLYVRPLRRWNIRRMYPYAEEWNG